MEAIGTGARAINQRMKRVIKFYDLSLTKFGQKNNITRESVSQFLSGDKLSPAMLRYFERTYPEINMQWIMTGKGQIFASVAITKLEEDCRYLRTIIAQQAELINRIMNESAAASPDSEVSDELSQESISHTPEMSSDPDDPAAS